MITLWKSFLFDVWRMFRFRIIFLVGLMMVNSLMEGMALALLIPLLNLAGIDGGRGSTAVRWFQEAFAAVGVPLTLKTVLMVILGISFLQAGVFLAQSWLASKLQYGYMARWRETLFNKYMCASWPFFVKSRSGELVNTLLSETDRVGGVFYFTIQLLNAAIVTGVYLGLSLYASWQATVLLLAGGGLVFVLTYPLVRKSYAIGKAIGEHTKELHSRIQEFIGGAKLVKATATESLAQSWFGGVNTQLQQSHALAAFHPSLLKAIVEFSGMALLCLVVVAGALWFQSGLASILMIVALFVRLVPRIFSLQQNIQLLSLYLPSVDIVLRSEAAAASHSESVEEAGVPIPLFADGVTISLSDLSFSYGDRQVLDRVTMEFSRGATVGIVGSSGSGKSTLVDCLLRLNEPPAGAVLVQGIPIEQLPLTAWRRSVGYVAQETVLFNDTIRHNILWGTAGVTDDRAMAEAARKSGAHDFIDKLSMKYETIVGDRGVRLSGGQKQRLGLARALVHRPVVLILDEATSALDSESEQYVLEAIKALHGEMTIIMIAHRLSTVRSADQIYVLEEGKVVENGTWSDLLAKKSRFSALWELQQAGH
jgi:ATP-binding cassette subfamily C protein